MRLPWNSVWSTDIFQVLILKLYANTGFYPAICNARDKKAIVSQPFWIKLACYYETLSIYWVLCHLVVCPEAMYNHEIYHTAWSCHFKKFVCKFSLFSSPSKFCTQFCVQEQWNICDWCFAVAKYCRDLSFFSLFELLKLMIHFRKGDGNDHGAEESENVLCLTLEDCQSVSDSACSERSHFCGLRCNFHWSNNTPTKGF